MKIINKRIFKNRLYAFSYNMHAHLPCTAKQPIQQLIHRCGFILLESVEHDFIYSEYRNSLYENNK